jgi:hypothetical protein
MFGKAKEAEVNSATKRGRKTLRNVSVNAEISGSENEVFEAVFSNSDFDCIIAAGRRAFSNRQNANSCCVSICVWRYPAQKTLRQSSTITSTAHKPLWWVGRD